VERPATLQGGKARLELAHDLGVLQKDSKDVGTTNSVNDSLHVSQSAVEGIGTQASDSYGEHEIALLLDASWWHSWWHLVVVELRLTMRGRGSLHRRGIHRGR
jgi:hypothetical protein